MISFAYGEGSPNDVQNNRRGQIHVIQDGAGEITNDRFDIKGNLEVSTRRLPVAGDVQPDWQNAVPLESDAYRTLREHDALSRVVSLTTPDGSVTRPRYNPASLLEVVTVAVRGQAAATLVSAVDYNGRAAHRNNVELGRHGRNRTNVWTYQSPSRLGAAGGSLLAQHPTVKPVAMVAGALLDGSSRGGIVLAGFGGSGTTLIAAERTGRRGYLLELDPPYVDLTINRYRKLTGDTVTHAELGVSFEQVAAERLEEDRCDA